MIRLEEKVQNTILNRIQKIEIAESEAEKMRVELYYFRMMIKQQDMTIRGLLAGTGELELL